MTGHKKLAKILETIRSGKSVYFYTMTRCTEVSPKTLARWEKKGLQLFKATEDHLYLASGKKFVCVDGCRITCDA